MNWSSELSEDTSTSGRSVYVSLYFNLQASQKLRLATETFLKMPDVVRSSWLESRSYSSNYATVNRSVDMAQGRTQLSNIGSFRFPSSANFNHDTKCLELFEKLRKKRKNVWTSPRIQKMEKEKRRIRRWEAKIGYNRRKAEKNRMRANECSRSE